MVTLIKHEINALHREYYIEKVNEPLLKAITILGNRYPEPTMENVLHPNTKKLIGLGERYLRWEGNPRIAKLLKALIRIVVDKIEHSPNYRDRFSVLIELIKETDWKPRSYNHPVNDWNEPKPYGGSHFD